MLQKYIPSVIMLAYSIDLLGVHAVLCIVPTRLRSDQECGLFSSSCFATAIGPSIVIVMGEPEN